MTRLTEYLGQVIAVNRLSSIVSEVEIQLISPNVINFRAGQFVNVEVADNCYRSYSISSDPANKDCISLLVGIGHKGLGSDYFNQIKVGDTVKYIGPSGKFGLPQVFKSNITFIATGTGVAPLFSMLYELEKINKDIHVKLYFGVRNSTELFGMDKIKHFEKIFKHFDYYICFSQEIPKEDSSHYLSGRVTNFITKTATPNSHYVICGNPHMVIDVINLLKGNGCKDTDLIYEQFTKTGN